MDHNLKRKNQSKAIFRKTHKKMKIKHNLNVHAEKLNV